ncbi:MAG TPA: hypothetical protein VE650_06300 [Acetobacteraceae bacterium]|nr:hypothetical protein [Acetobacteraceae bacterium]
MSAAQQSWHPGRGPPGLADAALDYIGRGHDWSVEQRVKDFLKPTAIGLLMIVAAYAFLLLTGRAADYLDIKGLLEGSVSRQDWQEFNDGFRTIGTLITGVAFGIGLVQWRAARYEASFEKYYDRLKLANDRFDEARKSILKQPAEAQPLQDHLYTMFVFAELDNLEYILEKHCLRYVHRDLVHRSLRHFSARCRDRDGGARFRAEVYRWVGRQGDNEEAGYQERTRKVASYLADTV